MKFLVLILVVVGVFWWLKAARRADRGDDAARPASPPSPAAGRATEPAVMVTCAHCGVHLPRAEALPGPGGVFCSEAHRAAGPGGPAR